MPPLEKTSVRKWANSQSRYPKGFFLMKNRLQKIILDFYNIYCLIIIVDFCMFITKMMYIELLKNKNRLDTIYYFFKSF
jgi:hypothetical protein